MDPPQPPENPGDVVQAVFDMAAANVPTRRQQRKLKKIGSIMESFVDGLDNLLGPSPRKLRDAEYIRLTDFCKHNETWKEYGKRPRTLALLRWLGCPEAIDGFVQDRLTDIALPYTERNLPRCVKGQEMRSRFLELQQYVLTNRAADLERPGGPHLNIERSAQKYFDIIKPLGSGGFGTVDHVISRLSLHQYALKRISRGQSFKRDKVAIRSFENELSSLKNLSHKHLVKLVGSYTDEDHIGLIMTPVADMNLEEYLSAPEPDCPDRKNCLRQFFGCLAAGVEYLHSQKIRHKDIKPKNVLVLRNHRRVLLTDFGTAHNWSDDPGGSSSGTVHEAYTERYCAPEVFGRKKRNESSDIWSLGCIFLEMSTVLSDLTVRQMQEFFHAHGNGRHFIRENQAASEAWCKKISEQLSIPSDSQVLDLGIRLCDMVPIERPTAAEIASEIVDFRGPNVKYHCGCCDLKSDHWTNMDMVTDMQNITRTEEWTMSGTVMPGSDPSDIFEDPSPINEQSSTDSEPLLLIDAAPVATNDSPSPVDPPAPHVDEAPANYKSPSAQEILEGMTVMYYDAEEQPVCRPRESYEDDSTKIPGDDAVTEAPNGAIHLVPDASNNQPVADVRSQTWRCDWPHCQKVFPAGPGLGDPVQLLLSHCRTAHGCHDFGRALSLLQKYCLHSKDSSGDSHFASEPAQLVNYLVNPDSVDIDPAVQRIRAAKNARREMRKKEPLKTTANLAPPMPVIADFNPTQEGSQSAPIETPAVSTPRISQSSPAVRFNVLPEDRRPETRSQDREFDLEEIFDEPLVDAYWPSLERRQSEDSNLTGTGAAPLAPVASFVPSFYLAAANQFTKLEINRLETPFANAIFVCGTLMLPTVLKACAEHYISEEGVYSSKFQRRLLTSPLDWACINESLQCAAVSMTPGVVQGFQRRKVKRRPWACLEPAYSSEYYAKEGPEVHGFLVSGLSAEALYCLEHWHNEEMPSRLGFAPKSTTTPKEETRKNRQVLFTRDQTTARIQQTDGTTRNVPVVVFLCRDHRYPPREDGGFDSDPSPWDINAFLRSSDFPRLCGGPLKLAPREESRLASTMGIGFLMRGDVLCSAVLRGDRRNAIGYIDKGYDVNARCRTYGTALQGAAAKGKDDMVTLLLVEGADVNGYGGRYNSPLIAAVVNGNEDIARQLLANKANVLAPGGRFINALYQAVSFSDISMAHLLLEKGAWLSENYLEILDLAAENGNRNMMRMLEDYDVRGLWKSRLSDQQSPSSETSGEPGYDHPNDSMAYVPYEERRALEKPRSLSLVRAVLLEALSLKGQRGKWTGIKAVRLLQTAIRMGASERIIDRAAPFLSSYERLVAVICEASKQDAEEKRQLGSSGQRDGRREIESASSSDRGRDEVVQIIPGSSSFPPTTYATGSNQRQGTLLDASDVFCLTCNGRGGKAGTERTCNTCNGSKLMWRREGTHSKRLTCSACLGRGYTFSSRDICRACHSPDSQQASGPVFSQGSGARPREAGEAPPPYTP